MARPIKLPTYQPPQAFSTSIPAPVGGWNARDAVADMPATDAVSLVNWWPMTTTVNLRNGYSQYATGMGTNDVQTLMAYSGANVNKLKAIAGGKVYDVSAGGAVGAAEVSGLANSQWKFTNVATAAGQYLVMVNGLDVYQVYDGTAWHKDGDGAPYNITGVTSSTLSDVHLFKTRLWFIQKNTLKAWYLGTNAIGGAANSLDLSAVFQRGGYLVCMGTWTIDAGDGVDDYAIWITNKGEVAVYQLTDPTAPTGIALQGIWNIGSPVGTNCLRKYRGDNLIICRDGVLPLASALQSSRVDPQVAITFKIQQAISDAIQTYAANFGWQLLDYPGANMLILNVPAGSGLQQQYVMNTLTGAWANFTGWAANCWELYNDEPFFGGKGFVGQAWSSLSDAGANIQANALQAFNSLGDQNIKKRFTRIRPTLLSNGAPTLYCNVNINFDTTDPSTPLTFSPITFGAWDSALWDVASWGTDVVLTNIWQGANGVGEWVAPRLKVAAMGLSVQWANTDLVYERAYGPTP